MIETDRFVEFFELLKLWDYGVEISWIKNQLLKKKLIN